MLFLFNGNAILFNEKGYSCLMKKAVLA